MLCKKTLPLLVSLATLLPVTYLLAQGVPEQFQAWGRQAHEAKYLVKPDLDTPVPVTFPANNTEKVRGFALFAKPVSAVITADYQPVATDRCIALETADCPGQYGSLTFFVYALRKTDLRMTAGNITNYALERGGAIPAANFDLRAARYVNLKDGNQTKATPILLESFDSKTIQPGRFQQFWITYHIPPNARPGDYLGRITLNADAQKFELPLKITVLPFTLPPALINFYIYHSTDKPSPDVLLKQLQDQHAHGLNLGVMEFPVTREGELVKERVGPLLDAFKKAGFTGYIHVEPSNRIIAEWLNEPDKTTTPPMWGSWYRYYPVSRKLDDRYVSAVRFLNDEIEKRDLKLMLAVGDEAGSHAWTIQPIRHYNQLIKDKLPEITRELTCGGGWASGEPEDQLWKGLINIWTTNRWLTDKLEIVKKEDPKALIQIYNMAGAGSGFGGTQSARTVYGYFAWKAQVAGIGQWAYNTDDIHSYTWSAADKTQGPIPTLHWEAVREGIKDYLYVTLLENLVATAAAGKAPLDAKTAQIVQQATAFLKRIKDKIDVRTMEEYDPIDGGRVPAQPPGTYEQWRAQIAQYITALQR